MIDLHINKYNLYLNFGFFFLTVFGNNEIRTHNLFFAKEEL